MTDWLTRRFLRPLTDGAVSHASSPPRFAATQKNNLPHLEEGRQLSDFLTDTRGEALTFRFDVEVAVCCGLRVLSGYSLSCRVVSLGPASNEGGLPRNTYNVRQLA